MKTTKCLDCGTELGPKEGWFVYDSENTGKSGTVCTPCHDKRDEEDEE